MRTGREVSVFVHRGGRLLLVRRTRDGVWHIPAGVVEDGETYREGAARELREEAGLGATELADLGCVQRYPPAEHERHAYPAEMDEVTLQNFAAEVPSGWEPRLDGEHTQHRWVLFDDALPLLHWDNTRHAFLVLRESLSERGR